MLHVNITIISVPLITCVTRNSVTVTKHCHEAGDQVSVSQSHRSQDTVTKHTIMSSVTSAKGHENKPIKQHFDEEIVPKQI